MHANERLLEHVVYVGRRRHAARNVGAKPSFDLSPRTACFGLDQASGSFGAQHEGPQQLLALPPGLRPSTVADAT